MSSANLACAEAMHNAFNSRDWDGLRASIAADCVFIDGTGHRHEGADAFTDDYSKPWAEAFSDANRSEPHFYDAGDTVIVEIIGRGTNDGPLGPMPATGRHVDLPYCEVLHFNAEGKVSSGHAYFDQMGMLAQLGHTPPAD